MNLRIDKNLYYILSLSLLWVLSPFLSAILIILFIGQYSVDKSQLKYLYFLVSLAFALLAYTQKSISAEMETDISRYYDEFSRYSYVSFRDAVLLLINSDTILTYTFTFVNVLLVSVFKNVQIISLVWISLFYYLHFVSMFRMMELSNIPRSRTNIFLLLIFSLFGAILFTQVTETIKNAVAFSFFFYLFTLFLADGKKWKFLLGFFIGIGIHSSILMLLPIFFYKRIHYKYLFVISLFCILICPFVNMMEVAMSILPDWGFFGELASKAEGYSEDAASSSSRRYIVIGLFLWIYSAILYKKDKAMELYLNIVLIYVIMMFLNYNNSHAFIRFANFAQFVIVLEFLILLRNRMKLRVCLWIIMLFFCLTNLQMTYGRTLSGGYCSSYMDKSIVKILTSNVYDYLTYKAYP